MTNIHPYTHNNFLIACPSRGNPHPKKIESMPNNELVSVQCCHGSLVMRVWLSTAIGHMTYSPSAMNQVLRSLIHCGNKLPLGSGGLWRDQQENLGTSGKRCCDRTSPQTCSVHFPGHKINAVMEEKA